MRIAQLFRTAAGAASLAVAATALAAPAHAATSDQTIGAAAARVLAHLAPGTISTADLEEESETVDVFERLADSACALPGEAATLNSNLVLLDVVESGTGPLAALVSADINLDADPLDYETTCTFVFLAAEDDQTFDGSYAFTVSSDIPEGGTVTLDPPVTTTSAISGEFATSQPVFTSVTEFAIANLTASGTGSRLSPAQRTVVDAVPQQKSNAAKKAAKKKYANAVTSAKKKYSKAGKTKAAKKTMGRTIKTAKKRYKKAVAPAVKRVSRVETYLARTPWSISGALDGGDQV